MMLLIFIIWCILVGFFWGWLFNFSYKALAPAIICNLLSLVFLFGELL